MEKYCPRCKQTKELTEFSPSRQNVIGGWCRKCNQAGTKDYYRKLAAIRDAHAVSPEQSVDEIVTSLDAALTKAYKDRDNLNRLIAKLEQMAADMKRLVK